MTTDDPDPDPDKIKQIDDKESDFEKIRDASTRPLGPNNISNINNINDINAIDKRLKDLIKRFGIALYNDAGRATLDLILEKIAKTQIELDKAKEDQSKTVPPVTGDTDADDEGVVVPDLPNLDKLEPTDTSEGTRIAEFVNPAEIKLFLSTDKEARDEQKRFEEFSRVEPGNSLGNARVNPLIRVNNEYYKKQFKNADKTMKPRAPYIVPTIRGIRRKPWSDPQFVDIYDGYEHGKVRFEEDSFHANRFMSNTLYNPMHVTDEWREFERPSTWHPELKLAGYRFKPTIIPEIRNQPGFKGVDSRPSVNNNINIAPKQTGYTFSPMRRDDDFEPNTKNGRPEVVRTQLTGFNQPVRMTSTRGGR